MKPYFAYIDGISFQQETREKLANFIMSNLDNFMRSGSPPTKYGSYDWNWFLPQEFMPRHLIDEVGDRIKIPVSYEILGQTPYTRGKIHVDRIVPNVPPRVCLLNFPIYPLDNSVFGPTKFFDLLEGNTSVDYESCKFELKAETDYSLNKPVLFNLQEYHCAWNDVNDHRFNVQLTTSKTFEEVYDLYQQGELFD